MKQEINQKKIIEFINSKKEEQEYKKEKPIRRIYIR